MIDRNAGPQSVTTRKYIQVASPVEATPSSRVASSDGVDAVEQRRLIDVQCEGQQHQRADYQGAGRDHQCVDRGYALGINRIGGVGQGGDQYGYLRDEGAAPHAASASLPAPVRPGTQ